MRQLVVDLEPLFAVGIIMGDDLPGKDRKGRITDPGQKPHQRAVREQICPAIDADQIHDQE